ncbi:hypothetical protein GIB67_019516 [Kingdonia uniflora]|uniref:Uncharacterized protein n=1 Tax=Kingdonia uniflora TaxID=39325 RepID=A0A7J7N0B4_9MAGN|nr:hypothetical protein GIB67_019516 [Kingdonia uniflora]
MGGGKIFLHLICLVLACLSVSLVKAEDPYRYYTWTVTYGTIAPLGFAQQVILINGQFPGPRLDVVTNDNLIVNVINKLDQPFLLTWNGIKQRKNSWQDGVLGTNCPIPSNSNYTYKFQVKDQIGTFTYFPSTLMHKAAGGFGGINVYSRPRIPIPYPIPTGDFTLLIGDWYNATHKVLQQRLDLGKVLPSPYAVLINGQSHASFSGDQGKTYMFKISNVGLSTSINFRIQGHMMKLVEVEGSHTIQNMYDSLDVHVGQSVAVLVTLNQPPKDYYIVASTRFTKRVLTVTGVLHYSNSRTPVTGPLPVDPTYQIHWSMKQARTFRWNLTANAARPNPQGSFHYGKIVPSRTIILANSAPLINGKQRYAVNGVSYINAETPLKLADYFNISGVFTTNSIQGLPSGNSASLATSVMRVSHHEFIEVVFQNNEKEIQSWHLDGYDFWVVGYGSGQWSPASRSGYNLVDTLTRHTVQVYPSSWTSILVSLDNQGMWNIRSAVWARQYLGQQFYLKGNGKFPGPQIDCVTNDNIVVNVINKLDQPFLITWNGIKQRKKSSWQDGVLGMNCPNPSNSNFTYKSQIKDQIGTFNYFPSTLIHKAAGGFGGLNVYQRPMIPRPFQPPASDYTLLIGDWYKTNHKVLQNTLNLGKSLAFPDAILINGHVHSSLFIGDKDKTYMFRISNVGLSTSFNFRIQGHGLKLAEIEGSHIVQEVFGSLDIHVGQSMAVLVTLDQTPKDYYIVASTRFTKQVLTATSALHYPNSKTPPSETLPIGPTYQVHWSMKQARTFRYITQNIFIYCINHLQIANYISVGTYPST